MSVLYADFAIFACLCTFQMGNKKGIKGTVMQIVAIVAAGLEKTDFYQLKCIVEQ